MTRRNIANGTVFGKWTVIGIVECKKGPSKSKCRCVCGTVQDVKNNNLLTGTSTQCIKCRVKSCGLRKRTHGCTAGRRMTPEYKAWLHMKQRCRPGARDARNYCDRGITVCKEWLESFETFLKDMGNRPGSQYSIERIDNNLGYSQVNCIWATRKTQNRNQRRTRMMTFYGKTMCMTDWAAISGVSLQTVSTRLCAGRSEKEAVWTPVYNSRKAVR